MTNLYEFANSFKISQRKISFMSNYCKQRVYFLMLCALVLNSNNAIKIKARRQANRILLNNRLSIIKKTF